MSTEPDSTITAEHPGIAPEETGQPPDSDTKQAGLSPDADPTVAAPPPDSAPIMTAGLPVTGSTAAGSPPVSEQPVPCPQRDAGQPPSAGSPDRAKELARLIAEGRRPRSTRLAELEPYRDVLLAERRAGASIRLLVDSLAKLGVNLSREALRGWLLRQKMPKRRRPRKKPAVAVKPGSGAATLPPLPRLAPIVGSTGYEPRRGPRIARDKY